MSLFLIDHALSVPILHWVLDLMMVSSEMNISCKWYLLIPFCLCNFDLSCLDLIGFLLILSSLILAITLQGMILGVFCCLFTHLVYMIKNCWFE